MNVYKYVDKYKFPNFDNRDFNKIYRDLCNEFLYDFASGYQSVDMIPFAKFKNTVQELLRSIAYLNLVGNGKFNADIIWKSLFSLKLLKICSEYYPFQCDESFHRMIHYFDKNKKKENINSGSNSYGDELLSFMGLSSNYTKTELIRRYRQLSLLYHPDKGGDKNMFVKLQQCKKELEMRLK